ncbi:mediator of RNA polymerase II transcription subunit 24 [Trypanosoma grayi]|uniref:mediator of RNA polymerase II transcription subunit 24 n=1 Tax=Trypanosoma grayi TaxID=71804 RepID=UPI0004F403D4|nr:mediator of RNA polymerase II transcription subunit 24 [Trypanosoma grayi]KEG12455.1 mediator of RNA polymerase II transcription subunit 24 [Trypanosoma grayi]
MSTSNLHSRGASIVAPPPLNEAVVSPTVNTTRERTPAPPNSSRQWVEVAMRCMQNRKILPQRVMQMLADTAQKLLEEDPSSSSGQPVGATTSAAARSHPLAESEGGEFSSVENASTSAEDALPATPRRWLAARFLLLGSSIGLKRGTTSSLRAAVRLAEEAVAAHRCPLTTIHLAWTCYELGCQVQDSGGRSTLERMARDLVVGVSEAITWGGATVPTEAVLHTKLAWLMALLGETPRAMMLLQLLVKQSRADVDALVLLSVLHSTSGEYDRALAVAYHLEQLHPQYVVGGLVLALMRHVANDISTKQNESMEELLAVMVARVQAVMQYTLEPTGVSGGSALAPDIVTTVVSDGGWSSRAQGAGRVAGHWALLAYVALEAGCDSIAELAVDAGLEYIGGAREEHRQAFADLVCCSARLKIDRVEKLEEVLQRRSSVAGIEGAVAELHEIEDERLGKERRALLDSNEILSLQTMLGKALEVSTAHAEAYLLLGRLYLLEALKAGQPQHMCVTRLVEAAQNFQTAIRCNPTLTDAYEGMGRVCEAQGTVEVGLSFHSSAAELAYRKPVIPFERFLYLLR